MTLTWFGWVYLTLMVLSICLQITKAGQRRDPYPTGGGLLFGLIWTIAIVCGVLFIGVTV